VLVLFDIDGTLLLSGGASIAAVLEAGRELFRPDFQRDGTRFGGGLDPLIYRHLCRVNGVADPDRHHDRYRAAYGRILERRLARPGTAHALVGAAALLDALEPHEHVTLGLLTGNYPETGRLKLGAAGLDPARFRVASWGTDADHRRGLVPVALERYAATFGRALDAERVVIVGDTPHDVDCGRAHGCRVLAVATGSYGTTELLEAGAHHAVEDLSDTAALAAWILG